MESTFQEAFNGVFGSFLRPILRKFGETNFLYFDNSGGFRAAAVLQSHLKKISGHEQENSIFVPSEIFSYGTRSLEKCTSNKYILQAILSYFTENELLRVVYFRK